MNKMIEHHWETMTQASATREEATAANVKAKVTALSHTKLRFSETTFKRIKQ
jgi:hypothetical protein